MKISTKITALISGSLILLSLTIGLLVVGQLNRSGKMTMAQIERLGADNIERIKAGGEKQLQTFREEIFFQKKEYLKSQVRTALSALEKALKDATSMQLEGG